MTKLSNLRLHSHLLKAHLKTHNSTEREAKPNRKSLLSACVIEKVLLFVKVSVYFFVIFLLRHCLLWIQKRLHLCAPGRKASAWRNSAFSTCYRISLLGVSVFVQQDYKPSASSFVLALFTDSPSSCNWKKLKKVSLSLILFPFAFLK